MGTAAIVARAGILRSSPCPIASISVSVVYTIMPRQKLVPMAIRLRRLSKPATNGCRIWQGNCTPRGYPLVGKGGHGNGNMYAHRAAWIEKRGPIPKGMQIHHTCENPRCINVRHMELTTQAEHRRKHHSALACGRGHKFTPANTYVRLDTGVRQCKRCRQEYAKLYYQNKH